MRDTRPRNDQGEGLPELFWSVTRRLRHTSTEASARWDITPSQTRALRVLRRHGKMRLTKLSEHLHIAPTSVTEVVDGLEGKELVRRLPDPGDRRAILIELTARGSGIHDAMHAAETERVFDRLSESEQADLARILRKLQQ